VRFVQRRVWRMLALLLALTLVAAACGDDDDDDGDAGTDDSGEESDFASLSGTIDGTGASFPDAFYQEAISTFADVSELIVNYNPVGSGQGKKDFAANLNNFAGTDSTVKPEEIPDASSYYYIPTTAAPITVSYNLSSVKGLKLSPQTLGGIMAGTIKKWDDAAIKADNSGVTLPSTNIVIVHRSDGSGTTNNFTKYLVKAAGTAWTLGSGDTVNWPADSQAGAKNTGVAQIIKSTDGAIGYVDLADATETGLVFAAIKNKAGKFVAPTLDGASAALAGATVNADLTFDPLDAAGDASYPITAPTYILVHSTYSDATEGENVVGFVKYLLTDGQDVAADVYFAKLPSDLQTKALAQLDKVTVG
jgi:phosphate transport system substrate-binding protein